MVDILIEERAQRMMQYPAIWKLVKRFLYPILDYDSAVHAVDTVAPMNGAETLDWVNDQLQLRLEVSGIENVPSQGAAIVVANHPAGIADGAAIWDALKDRRSDLVIFANRDAIRAAPGLADVIIPVEWVDDKRTHERSKETVKQMVQAFRKQRLVVIFPSGRLAQPTIRGLVERPWMPTAASLAQKYGCPLIPVHIAGRNSWFFYLLCMLNTELRDMTLFRELFNKKGCRYQIDIGQAVQPCGDPKELTESLRAFVAEQMPQGARDFNSLWQLLQTGNAVS